MNTHDLDKFAIAALLTVALWLIIFIVLKYFNFRWAVNRKRVSFEITPPANSDQFSESNQKFFNALHGLGQSKSIGERILGRNNFMCFEILSSKEKGIRFVATVAEQDTESLKHAVKSYIPDAKLNVVKSKPNNSKADYLIFKQSGHYAYPLLDQGRIQDHDPISYLTGSLTGLANDEFMTVQLVLKPARIRGAKSLANRMLRNEEIVQSIGRANTTGLIKVFGLISDLLFSVADGVADATSGPVRAKQKDSVATHKQQSVNNLKPVRSLSEFEQELAREVHAKLSQPLFYADLRVSVVGSRQSFVERRQSLRDWAALFNLSTYQALKLRWSTPEFLRLPIRRALFTARVPATSNKNSMILGSKEIADIYHFPHSQTARTENVVKSLSKSLPAPISLKGNPTFDVVLAKSDYDSKTLIGLTAKERERHVFIIGGTGNGKTTLIQYALVQDIQNGKGVAIVDPHGDLAETLLDYVPEDRIDDVIYFNPDDLSHPIGLNVLELTPGLEGDDLLREKDLVTESVISIFRKIFSNDDTGGHRIEYVLRNAIQTALTIEGATLFTVYNLLNDPKYCKKIVQTLDNQDLKNFWKNELGKAGGFQQVKMVAGITSKIGRFLFSASAKRILEQPKSTIDFDEILDGKILICNLSKGLLGEDTSELFGISILAKLQMASLRRARQKQVDRKPFYLYVDEFQNFATPSFVQMLSEARKYKLFLTMAEQSTSQQDDQQMVNIILANVGTVICFRSGNPSDERLVLPLFNPYVKEGEIANLSSYHFYIRVAAVNSQEPFSGETLLLEHKGGPETAEKIRTASRKNHATKYAVPNEAKPTKDAIAPKKDNPGKQTTPNRGRLL
ncbi:MAG TPA: type IV secretion system DNA-binding domain-containing protein [Candidatus Saccharimonadales bacterium]|nr:type IV secretion system DNA-binding domain-containing protein [Candidatus Saccharimonadales bacterium]